jgi:hypothetical protein
MAAAPFATAAIICCVKGWWPVSAVPVTSMGNLLLLLNDYMTPINFVGIVGGRAKFLTYRTELIQGQPLLLGFSVYFIQGMESGN